MMIITILFCVTALFGFLETAYFGFNWESQSRAETICDNIFLTMVGLVIAAQFVKVFFTLKEGGL